MRRNYFSHIPNLGALLKSHFFAGLLVITPLGVITWILATALGTLWRLHELLPGNWQPENVFQDPTVATVVVIGFTIGATLVLAMGISFLGWISKQYLGQKALEIVVEIIQRIPVIRSIHSALDQLLRALASGGGKQFNRVVYVEYPRPGLWTLAFVTGASAGPKSNEPHLKLYVPTTPNPTSGFYLIVPEKEVCESRLTVEEAFKTILSLGIAQPPTESKRGQ